MPAAPPAGAPALRRPSPDALGGVARLLRTVPWPICVITALAAGLRLAQLGGVAANPFYDAAVRSMSGSLHNFLFGAFEPGGALSIDKPPLDLWLQVLSVKLLGWGSVSLKLPEALAGIAAVPLLYDAVRRALGRAAALGAAATLAVLPESVLSARSDTMDSVMMLLVLLALWLLVRAVQREDRRAVVAAGAVLGLAFNVKLMESLVPVPALALMFWLASPAPPARRRTDLLLAGLALLGVGLSWAVLVSLAPGHHPWAIGSSDGSVWNAMFVFNGLGKVGAQIGNRPGGPGLFRLLVPTAWHFDVLFGCVLLPAAALGLAALSARLRDRRPGQNALARPSLGGALAIATAAWVLTGVAVFDVMRTVHARYLEALAPALAITVGLAATQLTRRRASGWPAPELLLALLVLCAYTFHFTPRSSGWEVAALIVSVLGAALLVHAGGTPASLARRVLGALVLACVLAYPLKETISVVRARANDSAGLATLDTGTIQTLSGYLRPRTAGLRYELAADEPLALAPLVISDQRAILPLTSFAGRPLIGVASLQAAVRAGAVRYALVGARACAAPGTAPACAPAAQWIRRQGVDITPTGLAASERLYVLSAPHTK